MHPQHTKCPPRQSKSQFLGHFWRFGGGSGWILVVFGRLLRATSKKRSSTFLRKKVHPQTKSWLRLCIYTMARMQLQPTAGFSTGINYKLPNTTTLKLLTIPSAHRPQPRKHSPDGATRAVVRYSFIDLERMKS